MQALETAVLLMEQAGCTEEDIMKYVHMIHMGWIRDGALAPEYLALVQQVQREQAEEAAAEARIQAIRDSVGQATTVIRQVGGWPHLGLGRKLQKLFHHHPGLCS